MARWIACGVIFCWLAVFGHNVQAAETMVLRVGEHANYARIVFEWPGNVNFTQELHGRNLLLRFNRAVTDDVQKIRQGLDDYVESASLSSDQKVVILGLKRDIVLNAQQQGALIIFDLTPKEVAAKRTVQPAAKKAAPSPADKGKVATPEARPIAKPQPIERPVPKPDIATPSQEKQEKKEEEKPVAKASAPSADDSEKKKEESAPEQNNAALTSSAPSIPTITRDSAKIVENFASLVKNPKDAVPLAVTKDAGGMQFIFSWPTPVRAVVFQRGEMSWIVFDEPANFALDWPEATRLGSRTGFAPIDPQLWQGRKGSGIMVESPSGVYPEITRQGLEWVVDFRPRDLSSAIDIPVRSQTKITGQAKLFMPLADAIGPLRIKDPWLKDDLLLVPSATLGRGLSAPRRFAEFNLLASLQGVAIAPRADQLQVAVTVDGVEIMTERGLFLSTQEAGDKNSARDDRFARLLDFVNWHATLPRRFLDARAKLEQELANAAADDLKPRLNLARFYLQEGWTTEVEAVLELGIQQNADWAKSPDVMALRGIAFLLRDHIEDAAPLLTSKALDQRQDIDLWRGALFVAEETWAQAAEAFTAAGAIPTDYPRYLQIYLGEKAAAAALGNRDYKSAVQIAQGLMGVASIHEKPALLYALARAQEASGAPKEAVETYEEIKKFRNLEYRTKASFALIKHRLATSEINAEQAIKELEEIRYDWRRDPIEFEIMVTLGNLYVAQDNLDDVRKGFRVLKQAITYYPKHEGVAEASHVMTERFADLYLNGAAEKFAPLAALAFFEEFRELTPSGENGETIIQKLADRMVEVDLLDQAASLLQHQVEFRLQGTEKARIGTRLALIRLMNKEAKLALEALDESFVGGIPLDLAAERNRLKARALGSLGQYDQALKLILQDSSMAAEQLRLDLNWESENWADAARNLDYLVKQQKEESFTEKKAQMILNLAVALSLSGQDNELEALQKEYGEAMAKTSFANGFALITRPIDSSIPTIDDLNNRFQDLELFESFLSQYHDSLKEKGLSETIN